MTATDGHPFWVPELGEWIDATDLQAGQWLQTGSGTWVQITAIQRWTTDRAVVHNLTVANTHTYYIVAGTTPILVHNSSCVIYGDLDEYGRATGVEALLTRDSIGGKTDPKVDPAGWVGGGKGEYHRAHLLGAQLGGSNTDPRNFVTMHAYANTPVMRSIEYQIRRAVEGGQTVRYSATPIYNGSELWPRAITIRAQGDGGLDIFVSILNRPKP